HREGPIIYALPLRVLGSLWYIRFYFAMPFLKDSEARAAGELTTREPPSILVQWIRRLLDDRKERIAIEQRLARHIAHLKRRLAQAFKYLDGLTGEAAEDMRRLWPDKKIPCPGCGAPFDKVVMDPMGAGGAGAGCVAEYHHADGTTCYQKEKARKS